MNRFAKKFRVLGSLCVLLNLAALLMPVTKRIQENYGDLTWSQLDYIRGMFAGSLSSLDGQTAEAASGPLWWILLFLILPLLLSVLAGIWGLAGSHTQKVSSILEIGVLLLYIGMAVSAGILWPEPSAGQGYLRGSACTWNLVFSGCGAVLAIAALAATPRKVKVAEKNIPQVEEIKQEQVEAKYNIVMEDKQEAPKEPVHGVLAGLTGIYAGAKIPLIDGEYVLLGRLPSNHLVFEGQANVSRKHCRIKWDAAKQKYIFRDYSSNGSFANGSEDCLPQNLDLELEPGTTIAIGDESNVFCLE